MKIAKKEKLLNNVMDNFIYNANTGLVYSKKSKTCKSLGSLCSEGYLRSVTYIDNKKLHFYIHRLAWRLYYGFWPEYTINHKNGIKTDNRIENLEDVTMEENNKHRFHTLKKLNTGINNGRSVLNTIDVLNIKYNSNIPNLELSKIYGVSKTHILRIKNNKAWKNL